MGEITGKIIHGKAQGRMIGYPTANISLANIIHPKFGVYAVEALLENDTDWIPGIANIGTRPSFGQNSEARVEVHLFNFDKNIYGCHIRIRIHSFIRDERKFNSLDS